MRNAYEALIRFRRSVGHLRLWSWLLWGMFAAVGQGEEPPAKPPFGDLTNQVPVVLEAKQEATLSSRIEGQIEQVPVVFGQRVQAGDCLVGIRDVAYAAALKRAKAVLQAAVKNLAMTLEMRGRADVSEIELENARRDVAVAEAAVQIAQEEHIACHIAAPFPGRVAKIEVNAHESVQKLQPMVRIVDDRLLLAHFLLPQSYFAKIKHGQVLHLRIPVLAETVSAKIERIAATFDPSSKTFEVYAEVDNAADQYRVGMGGWLDLSQLK